MPATRKGAAPPHPYVVTRRALLGAGLLAGLGTRAASALLDAPAEDAPQFLLQWGRKGKAEGEFDAPIGIAVTPEGEICVTDFKNARVQRFTPEGKFVRAFPVQPQPGGIAAHRNGNLYVGSFQTNSICVYSPAGELRRQWGREGTAEGEFRMPGGIAIAPDGRVYAADQTNRRVQVFSPEGKFLFAWGKYGIGPGEFGGNTSLTARTGGPQFVALDDTGNAYTTEASVGRVQKFTADGKYLLSWGDNGTGPGGFGGRPKNLPGPIAICIDRQGRVWVSSTGHRVQCFTPEGRFLIGMGGQGSAPGQFVTPHGLAVDRRGDLYVVDTQNARIQKFALPRRGRRER